MVAALKPWEEEEIKIVKKPEKKKTAEDKSRTKRVFRNANLSSSETAVPRLLTRGAGRRTSFYLCREERRTWSLCGW
jgi:ATP-dependent helicase Lhr and Lhr-like helicase